MKAVSTEFSNAFAADSMYLSHKLIVEFGCNRFNDGQVTTASSTKPSYRGVNSLRLEETQFWRSGDAFNNKNYNTMKWLVCDAGAQLTKEEDGSGYRCIDLSDDSSSYERGWWSQNKSNSSTGVFSSPEWVQSVFYEEDGTTPFVRRCNKISLYLTEGYSNMGEVTVQYKDENNTWVNVAANYSLGASEYKVEWSFGTDVLVSGLRAYVNKTSKPGDWARVSELQAYWTKDLSEYVVSIDVDQTREDYDQTVPAGTTQANTVSVELDNTESLFNINDADSIYAPYIGANNRVWPYFGIDVNKGVGTPSYEYVQMGEFWTDEWDNDGGATVARFSGRDFSKFLQDDQVEWGRFWKNTNMKTILTDILLYAGLRYDQINIDEANLRGFQIVFIKDKPAWELFGELAMADQGMFGFDENGEFYYHSYNRLDNAPYNTISANLSWDSNIIDASTRTQIYANKVVVKVAPYNTKETGLRPIWGPESPTILSWSELASPITATATSIPVTISKRQTTGNLTDNLWPETNGFLFIPKFKKTSKGGLTITEVDGGELIKYGSRSDSHFLECERGYLNTEPQEWPANNYIGEARFYTMEFDNAPALSVKFPFITAIDVLEKVPDWLQPQAHVIHFEHNAFEGTFAVGNIAKYYTWLSGTGQSRKDFDDKDNDVELSFATSIAGQVAVEKAGQEQVTEESEPTATNQDYLRRYGKNEMEISNDWIQTRWHAESLAKRIIKEYSVPRYVIDLQMLGNPALELGDRVKIVNYPQLSIQNKEYNIIRMSYSYDGGLQCSATIREVRV